MKEEEPRRLYLEYRAVSEQLQQVQQYLEQTAESIAEVAGVIAALDDLSQLRKGSRIFAPIANGIFVDATLNDSSTVRMSVGSGVVCQKPIAEAKLLLDQQRKELEKLQERAAKEGETLTARMHEIEAQVDEEKGEAEPAKGRSSSPAKH
jgi:prefoldin alpha subunit